MGEVNLCPAKCQYYNLCYSYCSKDLNHGGAHACAQHSR